jgi:hypothetical protein
MPKNHRISGEKSEFFNRIDPFGPFEEYPGTSAIVSTPDARCHKRSQFQRVGGASGPAPALTIGLSAQAAQGELKHGAARHVRLRRELSAVRLDDRTAD